MKTNPIGAVYGFINQKIDKAPHKLTIQEKKVAKLCENLGDSELVQLESNLKCHIQYIYSHDKKVVPRVLEKVHLVVKRELLNRHLQALASPPHIDPQLHTIHQTEMTPDKLDRLIKSLCNSSSRGIRKLIETVQTQGFDFFQFDAIQTKIEQIEDPSKRKRAEKNFMRLLIIFAGHEFGIGGGVTIRTSVGRRIIEAIMAILEYILGMVPKKDRESGAWKRRFKGERVSFEGFNQTACHVKMTSSLIASFSTNPLQKLLSENLRNTTIESFIKSARIEKGRRIDAEAVLEDWKAGKPVVIPSGWTRHAVSLVIYKDYLIYSNRGQSSDDMPLSGIKIYKITKPENLTKKFIERIALSSGNVEKDMQFLESPQGGMQKDLGLKLQGFIQKRGQKVGNCSWASTKCALQGLLTVLLHEEKKQQNPDAPFSKSIQSAGQIYKMWTTSHRQTEFRFIAEYIRSKNNEEKLFKRKQEWRVWGELFNKFYSKSAQSKRYAYLADKGKINNALVKEFIDPGMYPIQDLATPLKLAHPEKYIDGLLKNKLPGACVFAEIGEPKQLQFIYVNASGNISSSPLYEEVDAKGKIKAYKFGPDQDKIFHHLKDIQTHLFGLNSKLNLFPVQSQQLEKRLLRKEAKELEPKL